jgi:hypothetical protein
MASREAAQIFALCATLLLGAVVFARGMKREVDRPVVHTKVRSGFHISFVVVAPTSRPSLGYIALVDSARSVLKRRVDSSGHMFSTIGVADAWNTAYGMQQLEELGPFDEYIVGRNWLNSGIEQYVTALDGTPAVPQVVIATRHIDVDSIPYRYGVFDVRGRFLGEAALRRWRDSGFPISLLGRREEFGSPGGERDAASEEGSH